MMMRTRTPMMTKVSQQKIILLCVYLFDKSIYVFASVSSNYYLLRKPLDIDCKDMVFHLSVFSSVLSSDHFERKS